VKSRDTFNKLSTEEYFLKAMYITMCLVVCLWSPALFAKAASDELIHEEEIQAEDVVENIEVFDSQEELIESLSEEIEEDSEVVYVDDDGNEYILEAADYAQVGEPVIRVKKKNTKRKGRNCVAQNGGASWYGPGFHGRKTANGEKFNQNDMTAAHKTIKFNSLVRVTYKGKSVIVRINDAGPFIKGRVIDLSKAAAQELGLIDAGHGQVQIEIIRCGGEE
jgi:rare lipoprotein A (peptidoglycan hydrolase)